MNSDFFVKSNASVRALWPICTETHNLLIHIWQACFTKGKSYAD